MGDHCHRSAVGEKWDRVDAFGSGRRDRDGPTVWDPLDKANYLMGTTALVSGNLLRPALRLGRPLPPTHQHHTSASDPRHLRHPSDATLHLDPPAKSFCRSTPHLTSTLQVVSSPPGARPTDPDGAISAWFWSSEPLRSGKTVARTTRSAVFAVWRDLKLLVEATPESFGRAKLIVGGTREWVGRSKLIVDTTPGVA